MKRTTIILASAMLSVLTAARAQAFSAPVDEGGSPETAPGDTLAASVAAPAKNAFMEAVSHPTYRVEIQATVDNGYSPLWLNANRYGRTDVRGDGGYVAAGIFHREAPYRRGDRKWRIGYGLELQVSANFGAHFYVQQAFADFDYKRVRLSVGSKERPMELKSQELSSGSQTFGINARPVPQVRIEVPDYIPLGPWAGIKGHFGYGIMTDGCWQRDYVDTEAGYSYSRHAFYHSKAGYLRLGNARKFPLVFEGGLEMACIFGGIISSPALENGGREVKFKTGIKDFVKAIYAGGSDVTDGDYLNAQGNTVGSWLLSLKYEGDGWAARAYYDHFFEDHSQMFWQYGWLDGLIGLELTLPRNRFVSSFVYEYLRTTYQSGPIYHDTTDGIGTQISASDNYYNHSLFTGWEHWGQAMGNALFTSPVYYANGGLEFVGNRFTAHHFGLCGDPLPGLHYRLIYTHMRNLGNYNRPYDEPRFMNSYLVEATYAPARLKGWSGTLALGFDRGKQIGSNSGAQLSITKTF